MKGLFRESVKEDIIAKFYIISVEGTLNPINFPNNQFLFREVYLEYIIYHLNGLVSEKGKQYLNTLNLDNE